MSFFSLLQLALYSASAHLIPYAGMITGLYRPIWREKSHHSLDKYEQPLSQILHKGRWGVYSLLSCISSRSVFGQVLVLIMWNNFPMVGKVIFNVKHGSFLAFTKLNVIKAPALSRFRASRCKIQNMESRDALGQVAAVRWRQPEDAQMSSLVCVPERYMVAERQCPILFFMAPYGLKYRKGASRACRVLFAADRAVLPMSLSVSAAETGEFLRNA